MAPQETNGKGQILNVDDVRQAAAVKLSATARGTEVVLNARQNY
jgi:hypothetical protein